MRPWIKGALVAGIAGATAASLLYSARPDWLAPFLFGYAVGCLTTLLGAVVTTTSKNVTFFNVLPTSPGRRPDPPPPPPPPPPIRVKLE